MIKTAFSPTSDRSSDLEDKEKPSGFSDVSPNSKTLYSPVGYSLTFVPPPPKQGVFFNFHYPGLFEKRSARQTLLNTPSVSPT